MRQSLTFGLDRSKALLLDLIKVKKNVFLGLSLFLGQELFQWLKIKFL